MRYKAFISYSHHDQAIAKRLHRRLEGYRPPRGLTLPDGSAPERLYPIYRDREEMGASPSLPTTIETALKASDHLIVLCSPASAASRWVNQEVEFFAKAKGADRVLPVIVSHDPPECFPKAVRNVLAEPLAPDLREDKDGYADGVLKIIAGIWGVSLGALKNREAARQRRKTRLNAALAAVFAGLVVFAGFFGWRAVEQEKRAEAEAQAAEARSLASIARLTFDQNPGETSVAAMIAIQSLRLNPTPEAHDILRDALKLAPLGATLPPFPWLRPKVATSGDGNTAAFISFSSSDEAAAHSSIIRLTPELNEQDRVAFEGMAEPVFSTNGAWMTAAGRIRRLYVKNLVTGETAFDQPIGSGFAATFSTNGADLYLATQTGEVLQWSSGLARPTPIGSIPGKGALLRLPDISLSPKENLLFRSNLEQPGTIISLKDGAQREVPFRPKYKKIAWTEHTPHGMAPHPNGEQFVAYNTFNTGTFWDADTLEAIWSFDEKSRTWSRTKANVISQNGAFYARGRGDGQIIVRDTSDGAVLHRSDNGDAVIAITFLEQPNRFAAAGDSGASIWIVGQEEPIARCAPDAKILSMAAEATGSLLIGLRDGRLIRCDGQTGAALAERRFDGPVTSVATAPGEIAITVQDSDTADNWTELSFFNRQTGASTRLSLNQSFDQLVLNEDGSRAATRSFPTREIVIWNTATGEVVNRFTARGDIVGLTPNGDRLLMTYLSLDVFDVKTGRRGLQLGEGGGVSSLIANAYPDTIITEGKIDGVWEHWAWNAETGERIWRLPVGATITADGAVFAEHLKDKDRWRIVRRETGQEIASIPFEGDPWGARLSPDAATFTVARRVSDASGVLVFETELWDVPGERLIWRKDATLSNVPSPIVVPLSENRAAYVSFSRGEDGQPEARADIFDWTTGDIVFSITQPSIVAPRFEASPNGQDVLIAFQDETVLHRLSDGKRLWSVQENYGRASAFSPKGDVIIAGRSDRRGQDVIAVLDRRTGALVREVSIKMTIQDLAVTSDGRLALAALDDDEDWIGVRGWRLDDGAPVFGVKVDNTPRMLVPLDDSNRLVVLDSNGLVRSYELDRQQEAHRFPMSIRASNHAVSAHGARAVTSSGAHLHFWDLETGALLGKHHADGQLKKLTMTTDGAEIAFITRRKRTARGGVETSLVKVWRPTTDQPIEALAVNQPKSIAYGAADTVLVIGAGDEGRRVLDAATLSPRFTIKPMTNGKFTAFSNAEQFFTGSGRHIAMLEKASYGQAHTNEQRGAMRIFSVETGAEIARFDVNPATSGIAPTQNGFFYTDMQGNSRHFEIGGGPLDQVLADKPYDEITAIAETDLVLISSNWRGDALIDVKDGARINLTVKADDQQTLASAVDPEGRFVGLSRFREAGDAEPTFEVLIFDAKTGDMLAQTEHLMTPIRHLEFAENGEALIASESSSGSIITSTSKEFGLYKWRWQTERMAPLIKDNPMADFRVSANGQWLLTSEGGKNRETDEIYGRLQTRLINIANEETLVVRPHDLNMPRSAISADGQRIGLFTNSSPTTGDIVELIEGSEPETLLTISYEDAAIFGAPLGFIENSTKFVMGERSGARVYDFETKDYRRIRVPGRAKRYAISPEGALIAIGGDSFVSVWDLRTFEQITSFEVDGLRRIAFAGKDMRSLIAATEAGVVSLEWDQDVLISEACSAFQNDAWASGLERLGVNEAANACIR